MVLLAPLLLAGALANDVAAATPAPTPAPTAATPAPTAATPAPTAATPAPTPEKDNELGKPRGHTKDGIPIYKIPGSTNKGCQSYATIMLGTAFENSPMNETAAVKHCAHNCGTFYVSESASYPCTGFEIKDIPGNDIPGVQCTFWKGPCKLQADGTDDNIRGQYQIPPQSRFTTTQIAAAGAFLVLLTSVVYFMYPRKAPAEHGAKRGLKKPGAKEGSEATEDLEGHPLMGLEGHPGHAIALAAIAPEHRHWVEHYTPGSEKDLAERAIKFEVLTE